MAGNLENVESGPMTREQLKDKTDRTFRAGVDCMRVLYANGQVEEALVVAELIMRIFDDFAGGRVPDLDIVLGMDGVNAVATVRKAVAKQQDIDSGNL